MDIDKRNRSELKAYFVKNAVPTESNFAELIDATLNQKDDGVVKPAGNPLCIEASGGAESLKKAINFYDDFADAEPAWVLALNPREKANNPATAKAGFSIGDSAGNQRLFIDRTSGKVGLGTLNPAEALDVAGGARVGKLGVGRVPDRTLAIQGDARNTEISVSDNLFIDGQGSTVRVTNNAYRSNGRWAIKDPAARAFTMEIRDNGKLELYGTRTPGGVDWLRIATFDAPNNYVQFTSGVRVDGNRTTHLEADGAFYRLGGQAYITVDDNLYIRDMGGAIKFHFNTNAGLLHQQAWQGARLQNGWVNYSSQYNLAGYFKDSMGVVHLRGLVKNGTVGKPILTLPAGYQPERRELFGSCTNSQAFCRVDVLANGQVLPVTGNATWLSIDGLTFRAK